MNASRPPIERFFDLSSLSEAGYDTTIAAKPEELVSLARWEGVLEVTGFEGDVSLRRLSPSRFSYRGVLRAGIVQACVVTLEPVRSRIERTFSRVLHLLAPRRRHDEKEEALAFVAADDEAPEEIENSRYDLAAPLIEEFSLAIDPYPRAAGVHFEPPRESPESSQSPFAVLRRLKRQG